jgi:hypothetical protein
LKNFIVFAFAFLSLLAGKVTAQEMWGAANSNYAGQMGMDLNPASIAGAPYQWEIHFLSMDAALLNNFMYLKADSKIIRKSIEGSNVEEGKLTDRYTKKPDKFGYVSAFLKYPSFIWVGKKFSAGFHASTRAELSARNIPYHLAKYLKEGFDFDGQQGNNYAVKNAKAAYLTWHEIGLSGAAIVKNTPESYLTVGLTVNYNYGLSGFYALMNDVDYVVPYDSLLVINNMDATYGHAMPGNNRNSSDDPLLKRGSGYSFTTGLQYYKNRNDAFFDPCARGKGDKPYDYKIGFSILDVGYIKYTTSAMNFRIDNRSANWYGIDTTQFHGLINTDSLLSEEFYGTRRGTRDGRNFTMFLPTAASVQFDLPFNDHLFLNFSVIQRIPLSKLAIRRSNQIAITPRFESRRFEVALPISYYDFFKPRVGVSLRYGIFTIGSDMVSSLLGVTDTYGADFYFGITWKHYKSCGGANRRNAGRVKSLEKCKISN